MKSSPGIIACLLLTAFLCRAQPATNLWRLNLSYWTCQSSPALAPDGTIYEGTFDGKLVAIDPAGQIKWTFETPVEIKSSPSVGADGTIYFGGRDRLLHALTADGKQKWSFKTGGWVDSSPAIGIDGTVYFGSWDTNFYACNPDGSLKWKFPARGAIDSSPAIDAEGSVYFGSHDKCLYALVPSGALRWKFTTQGEITSSPAVAEDGAIYFTSTDGNLYALKPDGTERWRLRIGSASASSPVIGEDGAIYLNAGYSLVSVGADGKKRWELGSAPVWVNATPAAASDGTVYFPWPWRSLGAIQSNGTIGGRIDLAENVDSAPVIGANGIIYAMAGRFLAATAPTNHPALAKSAWPMFRADPQHTGRVHKEK